MQEMQETRVLSLAQEDALYLLEGRGPLEEGMAIHSSILGWRIPWAEEPGGLQSLGLKESNRLKYLSMHACINIIK